MLALEIHVKEALFQLLENHFKSKDKRQLWEEMTTFKESVSEKPVGYGNLRGDQWIILCPEDKKSDYTEWRDITLSVFLINNYPFSWGRSKTARRKIRKIKKNANEARRLRNKLIHKSEKFSTKENFDDAWVKFENILKQLNYQQLTEFNKLQTQPLETFNKEILQFVKEQGNKIDLQERRNTGSIDELHTIFKKLNMYTETKIAEIEKGIKDLTTGDKEMLANLEKQKTVFGSINFEVNKRLTELSDRVGILEKRADEKDKEDQSKSENLVYLKNKVEYLTDKVETFTDKVETLEDENKSLKDAVKSLKNESKVKDQRLETLKDEFNKTH